MDFAKVSVSRLRRSLEQSSLFSRLELLKLIISSVFGSILAIFSSAIVNSTLVEITINGFFAIVRKKLKKIIEILQNFLKNFEKNSILE